MKPRRKDREKMNITELWVNFKQPSIPNSVELESQEDRRGSGEKYSTKWSNFFQV